MAAARTGRRRFDPHRRDRIAAAAIEIVAERGVEGLTHRAVAAKADVPLGSTTYHFADLDDLLAAALERAAAENIAELQAWGETVDSKPDLASAMAELILRSLGPDRGLWMVGFELYVAALRRPTLRQFSIQWDAEFVGILTRYVDEPTARAMVAACNGLIIMTLLADSPPSHTEMEAIVRRICGSAG
ncbi:MAG: TetR/AcrR family transcriptional regulator, regulator of biofilm formation and stress response [Thermoleophilaceae bacterium]|jgi:DNA-binding transcriptional regulator YbjK|nr:TetR/AcrR family transcriptional regulator, regulator of biofilm formation and stress response [Thermoleophilaceae bacterium]